MNLRDSGARVLIAWRAGDGYVCNGKTFADVEALYDYQHTNFPDWAITLNCSPADRARLGINDNPYLAPAAQRDGAEPVVARGLKTLWRCVLLYGAAFAGAIVGTMIGRSKGGGPLEEIMPTVFGGILGLAVAIVRLHRHDQHTMNGEDNSYQPPTEPQEPQKRPSVGGWSKSDRFWLLCYAALAGGIIGGEMPRGIGGPLRNATPFALGVLIGLAIAVVFLLADDVRKKL